MDNLIFDADRRHYTINGDAEKVIEFDPSDYNILPRVQDLQKRLADDDRLKPPTGASVEELRDFIVKSDRIIREAVDSVFDSPVSDTAFGNRHAATRLKSGKLLYEAFLEAMADEVRKTMEADAGEAEKVNRYVDKYVK